MNSLLFCEHCRNYTNHTFVVDSGVCNICIGINPNPFEKDEYGLYINADNYSEIKAHIKDYKSSTIKPVTFKAKYLKTKIKLSKRLQKLRAWI